MPSDVKRIDSGSDAEPIEPPSVKLIVRLFLIPLLIVAAAVGVMFLIGLMSGSEPSLEEALNRLKAPGGERTASYLVGPASKQRYLDAKAVVDAMKSPQGMSQAERIGISDQLIDILDNHTRAEEGEVQHFMLLALGRAWQRNPSQAPMVDELAVGSRDRVAATLLKYANAPQLPTRKAAALASVYLAGTEQAEKLVAALVQKLNDQTEDIDVRIAAATALGPLTGPINQPAIDALHAAMRTTDRRHAELVWSSALSLAQLNQPDVADTILKLLDRSELAQLEYYDREKDPANPTFRKLSDQEQQRILINTMLGARRLEVPAVQDRLRQIAEADPSPRVRAAAKEILAVR